MKKIFFLLCLLSLGTLGFSQKYAIIDTRYILDKMPDYKQAQKQLDEVIELRRRVEEIEKTNQKMTHQYQRGIFFLFTFLNIFTVIG